MSQELPPSGSYNWVQFPGGELEGTPPPVRCPACLDALSRRRARGATASSIQPASARTLCFQCYRLQLNRNQAIRAAGSLQTASEARFQSQLPFEPVDTRRLQMLKAERVRERNFAADGQGGAAARRRRAQIAARHALRVITAPAGALDGLGMTADRRRAIAAALRAAELQLPESWLPFVVAQ